MSALAAELVWVRILVLHLGSRVYAFALLLGVYLLGIAAGSLLVWVLAGRITDPRKALAWVQLAAAAALACQLLALGYAGDLLYHLAELLPLTISFASVQLVMLLAVMILFLPVTVLFGASFPLAVAADPVQRSDGAHAGMVSAANTLGAIFGSLGAPFLLVPAIGCQRTLLILVALHLGVALSLRRRRVMATGAIVVTVATAILWLVLPGDWILRRASTSDSRVELLALAESLSATVLVKQYHDPEGSWLSLELNGVNVAGSSPALLAVQQLQGVLPLLQHPAPRQVLHVGFGSGGTCWAVSRFPVEQIDVVEISPEVLQLSDTYFEFINHHVLQDQRVQVILNDGRNYLLATDRTYDVILSDSIHPVFASNSTLYTLEYFRMCREHLNPGGVVSMWLPLYSLDQESYLRILAAFHEVFPNTLIWYDTSAANEFSVVTGKVEPGLPAINWQMLDDPRVASSLAIADVHQPSDLLANLILGPRQVEAMLFEVSPHEDDLPYVEYLAGRTLHREATWFDNLLLLWTFRSRAMPPIVPPATADEAIAQRDRIVREHLKAVRQKALRQ
jgi:spermidine synthase